MNNLTVVQMERTNNIRNFILKNNTNNKLDELKCKKCRGTGLSNVQFGICGDNSWSSWDCNSYCDDCCGIGFLNIKNLNDTYFSCRECNGTGMNYKNEATDQYNNCNKCKGTGFIDWIQHIFGG
jgi:hypothetical protein